jgi:hypothetical protein
VNVPEVEKQIVFVPLNTVSGSVTVTSCVAVLVFPAVSLTVSVTVYVPAVSYTCAPTGPRSVFLFFPEYSQFPSPVSP